MNKLYSIILLILSIFMIEQPIFSDDGCGKGSKKGKNGLCHVKKNKKKKKNSHRQEQTPTEKQIDEVETLPESKYPNFTNPGRPYGQWNNGEMPTAPIDPYIKPEPMPINPTPIVSFTLDPKISNNKEQSQGSYNMVTKMAELPDGRIFNNIIEQQSSTLNNDSIENFTDYELIGSYSKEKLYEKPKGFEMSIALHSSQETYYLFGIKQKYIGRTCGTASPQKISEIIVKKS